MTVLVNRTEALDASRAAVRERSLVLPRQSRLIEEFAQYMSADAKVLEEDEETGSKRYRYLKTGTNHFSLAFTYGWLAGSERDGLLRSIDDLPWIPEYDPWHRDNDDWYGRAWEL